MELPPEIDHIRLRLKYLKAKAQQYFHRYLVVFSGSDEWIMQLLHSPLEPLSTANTLVISSRKLPINAEHRPAKKLHTYLGSEVDNLIWDGFSGLNPDGLGAASGLVKGGGLFILLLPELEKLTVQPDADYLRMCAHTEELSNFGTRFLQRLTSLIISDPQVSIFKQSASKAQSTPPSEPEPALLASADEPDSCVVSLPTSDQHTAIKAIESVALGHRNRPLVIYADRGRGKSSALGLAAAKLHQQYNNKIIITAPSRRACESAFQHYAKALGDINFEQPNSGLLVFMPPDEIIETRPECHLLMVDEAASIPSPLLKSMLETYSRIVFSTTIHGYEGNGQGFAVRFKKQLDQQCPHWKSISLNQAIRWADNDPLERWIFDFLLLDAKLPDTPNKALTYSPDKADVKWYSQSELAENNTLLKQLTALLVLAHYQTSPSDIRIILDHPKIHIGVLSSKERLLGALLILGEGGINDADLAEHIFQGRRRPRGQLVPQALIAATGASEFMVQNSYRIMRIAVHPEFTNLGLGSALIQAAYRYAESNDIDFLSSSFGVTPELVSFWAKNKFGILKLGTHKDGASGTQSMIIMRAISAQADQLFIRYTDIFKDAFLFGLSRQHRKLSTEKVLAVLENLPLTSTQIKTNEQNQLQAFAEHFRSFDDSLAVLHAFILNCVADKVIHQLNKPRTYLLLMQIFQGRSVQTAIQAFKLTGKKQLDAELRRGVKALLDLKERP